METKHKAYITSPSAFHLVTNFKVINFNLSSTNYIQKQLTMTCNLTFRCRGRYLRKKFKNIKNNNNNKMPAIMYVLLMH